MLGTAPNLSCLWLGCALFAALGACGGAADKSGGPEKAAVGGTALAPVSSPKPVASAVLTGSVRMAAGASLPAYPEALMERSVAGSPDRGTFPPMCTPPKIADRMPVRVAPDGKLVGVMVALSDFKNAPKRAPKLHEVTIKDCRLTPNLVVAMIGDTLRLRNEVNFPFLPALGVTNYNEGLLPSQIKDIKLEEAGVKALLCGFTAPCGRSDIVVMHHPLFAVTGEDGKFRIDDFPANEDVKLDAWHPLFGAAELTLRLAPGETKDVELTLTPKPIEPVVPPTQPAAAPDGKALHGKHKVIAPE